MPVSSVQILISICNEPKDTSWHINDKLSIKHFLGIPVDSIYFSKFFKHKDQNKLNGTVLDATMNHFNSH